MILPFAFSLISISILTHGQAPAPKPYAAISVADMRGFHWAIDATKLDPNAAQKFEMTAANFTHPTATFGRDLNWLVENKNRKFETASGKSKTISEMRRGDGKKIICYMNWGRLQADPNKDVDEAFRGVYRHYQPLAPLNASTKKAKYNILGDTCKEPNDPWKEPWFNLKNPQTRDKLKIAWRHILDEAKSYCDAIEYDNSDVFDIIKSGRCGQIADAKELLNFTCEETHARGMSCILKNSSDLAGQVATLFDGVIVEQCFSTKSAKGETPDAVQFSRAFSPNKPIACIEYASVDVEKRGKYKVGNFKRDCAQAKALGFTSFVIDNNQSRPGDVAQSCSLGQDSDGAPPETVR